MNVYVLDASVAAKWFTDEPQSEAALRLLEQPCELHAPDFLLLELDSVLCKWIRAGIIAKPEAAEVRRAIRRVPIRVHPVEPFRDLAYDLANRTGRSVYDCLYLGLAALLRCPMVTADRKLCNALAGGPFARSVLWVEALDTV